MNKPNPRNHLDVVRLEDILQYTPKYHRNIDAAFAEIHENKVAIQIISATIQNMQKIVDRLDSRFHQE